MEQVEEKMISLEEIILKTEESLKGEDPRVEITRLKALFYKTKEALMSESKKQWLEAETKAANIAKQKASPHYEDSLIKQMKNAEKTHANKQANLLKKEMARPNWKNAEKRLSKLSPEQLKAVIANPKSSNVEVKVAQYLLG